MLALSIRLSSGFAGYVMFAIIARTLSPDAFGTFGVIFSASMLIGVAGGMGQQALILREIPKAEVTGDADLEASVYRFSVAITSLGSAVAAIAITFVAVLAAPLASSADLVGAAILTGLYAISQTTMGVLRVQHRTIFAIVSRDLVWKTLCVLGVLALPWVSTVPTATDVIWVVALSLIPIIAMHLVLVSKSWNSTRSRSMFSGQFAPRLSLSLSLMLVAVLSNADSYLYTISLGPLVTPHLSGVFFAGLKTVELISLFLISVTLIVAPEIARSIAKNDKADLQRVCNQATLMQSLPTLGVAALMFFFAPEILSFFDPSFELEATTLRILVVAMVINALTGATSSLLQFAGLHWHLLTLQSGALLLGLGALPFMVSSFGLPGAATSFCLAKGGWNVVAVILIKRRLGLDPSIVGLLRSRTSIRQAFSDLSRQIEQRAR